MVSPGPPNRRAYSRATAHAPARSPARRRRASSPSRQPESATSPSTWSARSAWVSRGAPLVPARFARLRRRHRLRYPAASRASSTRCGPRWAAPTPRWSSFVAARWPGRRARSGRGLAGMPAERPLRPGAVGGGRVTPVGRPAARDDEPVRVRDQRVGQLHLHPDHRVEARLLCRRREPDDPVEAPVIRDGKAREPQLHGPRDEVRGRRGAVEEGEVRVRVELRIGRRGHGTTRWTALGRDGGAAVAAGGDRHMIEHLFDACQDRRIQQTVPLPRQLWRCMRSPTAPGPSSRRSR